MKKRFFISWSGEKSKSIAILYREWLQDNFKVDTWLSIEDIEYGKVWHKEILKALNNISFGLFFITKENWDAPWINFEAGAISKGYIGNNVCIINIDIDDIPEHSPLRHFQRAKFEEEAICRLTKQIFEKTDGNDKNNFMGIFEDAWSSLYNNYKKKLYNDNPLIEEHYQPKFSLLIPEDKKASLEKADRELINQFFVHEYEKIDPHSIGKRLQFIIDRAVILVYLYGNTCWGKILFDLERANGEQRDDHNSRSYNVAIQILRQVFYYHKMMHNECGIYVLKSEPENICDELLKLSEILNKEKDLIKNKMVYCLLYDYIGLCYHKRALLKIAEKFEMDDFNILDRKHRLKLNNTVKEQDDIADFLNNAINYFNLVLEKSDYDNLTDSRDLGDYIWNDFALYNKARCEYLLYCCGINNDQWKDTMRNAVRVRKYSVDRYDDMPLAISANLYAEYLHAKLEDIAYRGETPNQDFVNEYNKWLKLCYSDVLNIQKKYESINKFNKKSVNKKK